MILTPTFNQRLVGRENKNAASGYNKLEVYRTYRWKLTWDATKGEKQSLRVGDARGSHKVRHFNICDYDEWGDKCYDSIKTYGPPCVSFETDMSTLNLMWAMFSEHSYLGDRKCMPGPKIESPPSCEMFPCFPMCDGFLKGPRCEKCAKVQR